MINIIGISFISLFREIDPFIFFVSVLPMVWGGLQLIITIFLRLAIMTRYQECRVLSLAAIWVTLFQLAVFAFNWIDKVTEGVDEKVGRTC
jgi:hypothetical protein